MEVALGVDMDIFAEILLPAAEAFEQMQPGTRIPRDPQAVLFGESGALDSLGLVNYIVLVEEKLESRLGRPLALATEKAMSRRSSPFRSLEALSVFIGEMAAEGGRG